MYTTSKAGVVPCGGPKKSPRTSSIVQIIFLFRSFEISKDIQSVQNTASKGSNLYIVFQNREERCLGKQCIQSHLCLKLCYKHKDETGHNKGLKDKLSCLPGTF